MTRDIPLFPLSIFLLPGDYTQLYIFEQRYKQLIRECAEQGKTFGIAFTSRLNTHNYGCEVELVEILKTHPEGEMDIVIKCTSLFKLQHYYFQKKDKIYPGGSIETLSEAVNYPVSDTLLGDFREHLVESENFNSELLTHNNLGVFDLANELYMGEIEKLELVHLAQPDLMNRYLMNYLRYLKLIREQEKSVFKNIYLN